MDMSDHKQSIVSYFVDVFVPHVLKLVCITYSSCVVECTTIGTFKGHQQ